MSTTSKATAAKIFLADQRGTIENEERRSQCTFNCGAFNSEHKQPFAGLHLFNEETLAAGSSCTVAIPGDACVFILPVTGSVACTIDDSESQVEPGQLLAIRSVSEIPVIVSNPYAGDLVNFMQFNIKVAEAVKPKVNHLFNFDLDRYKNHLIEIGDSMSSNDNATATLPLISIGKFHGRKEASYRLKSNRHCLFVFVIEGVFEVQGRLLHQRDGLGLWNLQEDIELEALSNNAIIMTIELQQQSQ